MIILIKQGDVARGLRCLAAMPTDANTSDGAREIWIKEPLILEGETLLKKLPDADGYPSLFIRRADGYIALRQWDNTHGWGDRCYRTLERAEQVLRENLP